MKEREYKIENELPIPPICNVTASYCEIFSNMGEGVSVFEIINDEEGKIIDLRVNYVNPASILNKLNSREKVIGKTITELFNADKVLLYLKMANKTISTGKETRFETYFGQLNKHFLINAFSLSENLYVTIDVDISKEKEAESKLKESEKHYRRLLENSFDAVVIHGEGKIISANGTAAELFGVKNPEELVGKILLDFVHPDYKKVVAERVRKMLKDGKVVPPIEEKFLRIDGKSVDVEVLATALTYNGKKAVQVVFRDITERKKAQEELKEAHDKLEFKVQERTRELEESNKQLKKEIEERKKAEEKISRLADVVEYSDDAIISLTLDGTINSWNRGAEEVYGYSAHEMIGKHSRVLIGHSQYDHVDKSIRKLENGEKVARYIAKRLRKDSKEIYVSVKLSPIKNSEGIITGASVIVRDITERIKAENALKDSEEKFREIFNQANDMIGLTMADRTMESTRYIDVNEVGIKRLGYSRGEFLNMGPADIDRGPETLKHMEKFLKEGYAGFETVHVAKDGRRIPVDVNIQLINYGGKKVGLEVVRDITGRKKAEKALKESEEKYRTLFNSTPDYTILIGLDGKLRDVNKAAQEITGLSKENLIGKNFTELGILLDEEMHLHMEKVSQLLKGEIVKPYESKFICNSGKIRYVETYLKSLKKDGEIFAFNVISHDVTDRKKAEDALKESETKFRELFNKALDMIVLVKLNENGTSGKLIEVNEAAVSRLGYSKEELLNITPMDLLSPESRAEISQIEAEFRKKGHTTFEIIGITRDGKKFPIEINVHIFNLEGKKVALALARDITERKKVENELRESEERLEIAMDLAKLAYWEGDVESGIFTFNDRFYALYGTTSEQEGGLQMSVEEYARRFIPPEEHYIMADAIELPVERDTGYVEHSIIRADGEKRFIVVHYRAVKDDKGRVIKTYGANQDITELKKAEIALKESETKFRELFNKVPDMISLNETDENCQPGKIIEVNESSINKLGYSREEFLNLTPIDLFAHDNLDEIQEITAELQKRGYATFESVTMAKDGSKFPVEVTVHIFKLRGKYVALAISRDITERKKAEDTLKESEEKYRSIFENSMDAILLTRPDGSILDVNRAAEKMYGYKKEEICKLGRSGILDTNDQRLHEALKERARTGKFRSEYYSIRKDGTKFLTDVTGKLFKDDEGNDKGIIITRDVTERKKAEEEIKRSNLILNGITQIFREALTVETEEKLGKTCLSICEKVTGSKFGFICEINEEEALDTIAISDPGWNESKMPQSDDTVKSLKGMKMHGLHGAAIKPSKNHGFFGPQNKFCRRGEPVLTNDPASHPNSIGTPEGHPPINAYLGFPLKYGNETMGVIGLANKRGGYTLEDQESVEILSVAIAEALISFRSRNTVKEYRDQLEETVEELRQSNDELRQFAYITSHDLQEPLRTIASFTQLIERRYKGQLDTDADEYIKFIVDAAVRMKEMIQGLLDYSHVGSIKCKLKPVDTEKIIKTVLYDLHVAIEENKAEITSDPLPTVVVDKNQLIQLFQNLIGNAIKFKKPDMPPKIHMSCQKDEEKNKYIFSVSDNGIGMDPQYTDKIFGVFKRLHTIDEYNGAGIGLAISKRIVERHGGHIWVESEHDVGSVFYFTLPVRQENP